MLERMWFVESRRAGGAGPVAQAMAGPIFPEVFRVATCSCRLEIRVLVACKLSAGDSRLI